MIVEKLLKRSGVHTKQFLYGMAYKSFNILFNYFYTDCTNTVEFSHNVYIKLVEEHPGKFPKTIIERYSPRFGALVGWVYVVSRNLCIRLYKKHRKIIFVCLDDNNESIDPDTSLDDITLSGKQIRDANYYCQTGFSRLQLEKLIMLMPNERYRTLLKYRYIDNLDYSEIASKMDETESLCRKTRYKAVDQLKNVFIEHAWQVMNEDDNAN